MIKVTVSSLIELFSTQWRLVLFYKISDNSNFSFFSAKSAICFRLRLKFSDDIFDYIFFPSTGFDSLTSLIFHDLGVRADHWAEQKNFSERDQNFAPKILQCVKIPFFKIFISGTKTGAKKSNFIKNEEKWTSWTKKLPKLENATGRKFVRNYFVRLLPWSKKILKTSE